MDEINYESKNIFDANKAAIKKRIAALKSSLRLHWILNLKESGILT